MFSIVLNFLNQFKTKCNIFFCIKNWFQCFGHFNKLFLFKLPSYWIGLRAGLSIITYIGISHRSSQLSGLNWPPVITYNCERMCDCCLTPVEQYFSYIVARTSYNRQGQVKLNMITFVFVAFPLEACSFKEKEQRFVR
jgi:hypothetical protein